MEKSRLTRKNRDERCKEERASVRSIEEKK
jgi:hypothetical protein